MEHSFNAHLFDLHGCDIADRYKVVRLIARGSMGVVYEAKHLFTEQRVALKVMHQGQPTASDLNTIERRLMREGKALANLHHDNIVDVLDCGAWVKDEIRLVYLVMEYVDGQTLSEHRTKVGHISEQEGLLITRQIADALSAAHEHGIIHRDLKPSNVMITSSGKIKVVDFGIAKMDLMSDEDTLTQADGIVGTPRFMSPEQILNRPLDARTDLYALGCLMHYLFTGAPPFLGETSVQTMSMHLSVVPPQTPGVSAETQSLIHLCLAKSPEQRAKSGLFVVDQIDAILQGTSTLLTPPPDSESQSPWMVVVGAITACLLLLAVMIPLSEPQKTTKSPPIMEPSAPAQARPSEVVEISMILVDSNPSGATVHDGDTILGVTPLSVAVERPIVLFLEREGYRVARFTINESSANRLIHLDPLPKEQAEPKPAPPPKRPTPKIGVPLPSTSGLSSER